MLPALWGNPHPAENQFLVLVISHTEALAEADGLRVFAQYPQPESVQCSAGDVLPGLAQPDVQARRQLLRRFVRIGHGADPLGRDVVTPDQVLDPADQAERLAGPRPRQNEYGPERRLDRF